MVRESDEVQQGLTTPAARRKDNPSVGMCRQLPLHRGAMKCVKPKALPV